jgi:(3S)-malyl-CoA thioesterase
MIPQTLLYVPAHHQRALAKVPSLQSDGIILDLEDAILSTEKDTARASLVHFLSQPAAGPTLRLGRINRLDSAWGMADIAALQNSPLDSLILPKVETADEVLALRGQIGPNQKIWAMIETPCGVLAAAAIAAVCDGIILGTSDLAKSLGIFLNDPLRPGLVTALSQCVLAARAHRIPILDGVYPQIDDEDGLHQQATQGRDLGFDGKTAIHPCQLSIIKSCFRPDAARIAQAQAIITAFETASAAGQGVVVFQGRLIEQLDVDLARLDLVRAGY